jgi:hypothetical protein
LIFLTFFDPFLILALERSPYGRFPARHETEGGCMARKKGKSVSFDAMVKFFIHHYEIPTKRDVEKLMARLDRIENQLKTAGAAGARRPSKKGGRTEKGATASDTVLETIKSLKQGAGFADIQAKTGYNEKKLRNIIFRLNKLGKIKRKSRGVYTAV